MREKRVEWCSLMTIIDFEIKFHFIAHYTIYKYRHKNIIKLKRTKMLSLSLAICCPIALSRTYSLIHQTHVVAVPIDSSPCERVYFCGYMQSLVLSKKELKRNLWAAKEEGDSCDCSINIFLWLHVMFILLIPLNPLLQGCEFYVKRKWRSYSAPTGMNERKFDPISSF